MSVATVSVAFLTIILATQLHAQTFTVLHGFGYGLDGYSPFAGLTIDAAGNLYGTTRYGGSRGDGIAFKLSPHGSAWIYSEIHNFAGPDGAYPTAKLLIGRDGSLYGSAAYGGSGGYGTVFNLRPSPTFCASIDCPWGATVLQNFSGYDGIYPTTINFDSAGNIYGTTAQGGGASDAGVVYKLTPSQGSWTYTMITNFLGSPVSSPESGVIPDQDGNLYGTGSPYPGVVFEVTNTGVVQILFQFTGQQTGIDPFDGLISDNAGNLYGMTAFEGPHGNGGTVFELSPSNGSWSLNTLYSLSGGTWNGPIGIASLTMDAQGDLYGTTPANGAHNYGTVFKLTPSANGWVYTDLHDFTGGDDGCYPWSDVVMDSRGNLYGTASGCGPNSQYGYGGTAWKITP